MANDTQTVTLQGPVSLGGTDYVISLPVQVAPASAPVTPPAPPAASCLLGVYDPADNWPSSFSGIQAFTGSGCPVRVGTYYMQWQGGWPANFQGLCKAAGVTALVEIEPWFTTSTWPVFTDIAAGKYDSWLVTVANAIKAAASPVLLTYAHEQNGSWYPWGNGGAEKVTPAQWVASWNHVTSVINAVAGQYVTWVWAPNNADVGSVEPYYPGDASVGIAGFDAYLRDGTAAYGTFMAQTVAQIKAVTSKPVWLAETGIAPAGPGRAARVTALMSDLKAAGVSGAMWFNQGTFALTAAEVSALAAAAGAWNA